MLTQARSWHSSHIVDSQDDVLTKSCTQLTVDIVLSVI